MSTKVTSPNSYRRISTISPGTPKPLFQKKEVTYVTDVTDVTFLSFFLSFGKEEERGGAERRLPTTDRAGRNR